MSTDERLSSGIDKHPSDWELVAGELTAALHAERVLGQVADSTSIPAGLVDRVVADGEVMVSGASMSSATPITNIGTRRRIGSNAPSAFARALSMASGWLAAAAVFVFWIASANRTAEIPMRADALRDSILVSDSTASTSRWTATADQSTRGASGSVASGDVVWSARAQRGVMRFAGLIPNDRRRWQYQLWIFDKRRDQRFPVDGGVFDIPAGGGEVLIPISPRIPVGDAIMFAITVEPAGGVVVSTRERLALLAKVGG